VLKEFNKTIIPFGLVGYETGYTQLGPTYASLAIGIIVKYKLLEFKHTMFALITINVTTSHLNFKQFIVF